MSNYQSALDDSHLVRILFAVMVKRLGGKVRFTQADIDDIAYSRLMEDGLEDGSLEFRTEERTAQ